MSHSRPCSSAEASVSFDFNKMSDVFLCFRGPDTRQGFVKQLYYALVEGGISTFLDEECLEKGDHIPTSLERGITGSRICIPIFSKNFAQSKWCLKEVSLMVKSGVKICPLFYDVLPAVLRCRDGTEYAEYFKQHESQQRLSADLILEYKSALESVSNLFGWCFNPYNGRDDDLMIQRVVADVKKSLHSNSLHKVYLDIPECFGLKGSVEQVKRLLNAADHRKKIVKVGIHGMGGLGKTTLAKIVCKELPFSQFEVFSFLPSVGERCREANGLVNLQTQILKDVSKWRGEVDHVDQGKGLLQECLRGKRVLLLLDDIESSEQLEALGGNYSDFGTGSRIIITSRNQQILKMAHVNEEYEVRSLTPKHALRLFDFHAFPASCCPDQLQTLRNDVVTACEGLPLALQTFGKFLIGKRDRDVWKDMVVKLRCEPNIQEKLRLSYDSLDPIEKEMFQDIACFFTWRKKEIAMIFWQELIPSPHACLINLLEKSLVKLGPRNEFLMHRCLRDLGRSIANEMSTEPRKRTRLFGEDDVYNVLRRPREKANRVRYLLYEPKEPMTLKAEMFKSLYNLRLLSLTDVAIEGHFSEEFSLEDLRLLSLTKYSSRRLPQGMSLHNLVILEVTHSQITHLWDETTEENPTMMPRNLKVLILRGCTSLESLPATLYYTPLQMLDLHNCHSLSSLPNTVGSWTSLVSLEMGGCSVSYLPQDFGELANLQELNLSYCQNLSKLPDSFGNLIRLERLEIRHNSKLTELPASFGGLKALAYLDAGYCRLSDSGLPAGISELRSLKIMHLEGNGICRLPCGLENLGQLEELHLDGCSELAVLSALPASLQLLHARHCFNLDTFYCLPGLPCLMTLDVSKSSQLTHFHGVESLQQLTTLNLVGCKSISCGTLESCFASLIALESVFVGGPGVSSAQLQIFYSSFKVGFSSHPETTQPLWSMWHLMPSLYKLLEVDRPTCASKLLRTNVDLTRGDFLLCQDFSFSKNCLLANPDATANWLNGQAGGKDGYEEKCIDYCTDENKVEHCAGYIVCSVSSGQIRQYGEVDPAMNRLSYTVQRDDSLLPCPVKHQNSTTDGGDYLEVRLVRTDTTPDFPWLKKGDKVRVNASSDYENWKASFKFLIYEASLPSEEHKPPQMITFRM